MKEIEHIIVLKIRVHDKILKQISTKKGYVSVDWVPLAQESEQCLFFVTRYEAFRFHIRWGCIDLLNDCVLNKEAYVPQNE